MQGIKVSYSIYQPAEFVQFFWHMINMILEVQFIVY